MRVRISKIDSARINSLDIDRRSVVAGFAHIRIRG
jgi:hypothetical protein